MVLAWEKDMAHQVQELFRTRQVEKKYWYEASLVSRVGWRKTSLLSVYCTAELLIEVTALEFLMIERVDEIAWYLEC